MKRYVTTDINGRLVRRERDLMLPLHEPRCAGKGCEQRDTCERYNRLVFEANRRSAQKGYSISMTLADDSGMCRRKL